MTLVAREELQHLHCGFLTHWDTVQRQKKVPPAYGKAAALVSCCNHVASCRHLDDAHHTHHTHTHTHTHKHTLHTLYMHSKCTPKTDTQQAQTVIHTIDTQRNFACDSFVCLGPYAVASKCLAKAGGIVLLSTIWHTTAA